MYKYPWSKKDLNPPSHFLSCPILCVRAIFRVYKAICERITFFLPTPTVLSLNPLISGCEILPSISSILNDFPTPLAILFTFLDFLSSPLHQGVHLEGKIESSLTFKSLWPLCHQQVSPGSDPDAEDISHPGSRFSNIIPISGNALVYAAIVLFQVYSATTNLYLIVFSSLSNSSTTLSLRNRAIIRSGASRFKYAGIPLDFVLIVLISCQRCIKVFAERIISRS